MARTITKAGFDLGLVTNNGDAMLEFYRDVVGLEFEATLVLEAIGIARMDRLLCNDSVLKLVTPTTDVPAGSRRGNRWVHGLAVCHDHGGRRLRRGGRLRSSRRAGRLAPAGEPSRGDDRHG